LYDDFGWDFEVIGKTDRTELMAKMVYCAAKAYDYKRGRAVRYKLADVARWVAESRTSESERLRVTFEKSMAVLPGEMASKAEAGKKKQRGMT